MPTCEEIHEAYLQGEEAVVALFERTIGQLAVRVAALEDQRVECWATEDETGSIGSLS